MKFDRRSIGFKLFLYFTLLAAAILCMLWLLQTVFLQGLYEGMMTRELERVAGELAAARDESDFEARLDQAALSNNILVYAIDENGSVTYSTDEHMSARRGERMGMGTNMGRGRGMMAYALPSDYQAFLSKGSNQSVEGRVHYTLESGDFGREDAGAGRPKLERRRCSTSPRRWIRSA